MEQIIKCLRRKSQLLYDINCIQKYIEGGYYDQGLKDAWNDYNEELKEIQQQIDNIRKPELDKFEHKKLELLSRIKKYEDEIRHLKQNLNDLDKIILKLK